MLGYTDSVLLLGRVGSLLHLQSQQGRLRTAHGRGVVSSLLVESVTALVESVHLRLTFLLLERVLGQAIWLG